MQIILWLSGSVLLLYYAACVDYAGWKASYIWIWLVAGTMLAGAGFGVHWLDLKGISIPLWIRIGTGGLVAALLLFVFILFWEIGKGVMEKPRGDIDVLIVLGARVIGERPSKTLVHRLECAGHYLKQHSETTAILSGGQGADEGISEAEAMHRFLTAMGIAPERLIREDKSTTTVENLRFSRSFFREEEKIGIVTSDFHMTRSLAIARKLGYHQVSGLPAEERTVLTFHYWVRESIALLKAKVLGNI